MQYDFLVLKREHDAFVVPFSQKFKGEMIMIILDLNKIATQILEIHNKKIYTFIGDYDYYIQTKDNIHQKY